MRAESSIIRAIVDYVLCRLPGIGLGLAILAPASLAAQVSLFAVNETAGRGRSFTLVGLDLSQPINKTVSLAVRILPNYLTYKFHAGDKLTQASSPGVSAVSGLKFSWRQTTIGIYGGVERRHTNLKPDDPNARVRGNTLAGLVQGEIDSWFSGKTNVNVFASYSGTGNYSYEKGKIRQQISNYKYRNPCTLLLGVEQFVGRNAEYQSEGVGASLELYHIRYKMSVGIKGGFIHDSVFANGAYWGLQFYKAF